MQPAPSLWGAPISLRCSRPPSARRGTVIDKVVQLLALTGQAIPSFWLGIVLIFIFAVHLRWLPAGGMETPQSVVLPAFALGCQPPG